MNKSIQSIGRNLRSGSVRRRGISLFEVLIAILVAAIGIFGVILLIPFAWETAERGIDRETAVNAAQNYYTDFIAYGFTSPDDTWFDEDDPPIPHIPSIDVGAPLNNEPPLRFLPDPEDNSTNIVAGWPYVIDPIRAILSSTQFGSFGQVPDVANWLPANLPVPNPGPNFFVPDDLPALNRLSLLDQTRTNFDPTGLMRTPVSLALANRFSRYGDRLVFNEPATDTGPPRQAYSQVEALQTVKRQTDARFRTISVVVPEDDAGIQYRMYILVLKEGDRDDSEGRVFEIMDPVANSNGFWENRIDKTVGANPGRGFNQIALGGGDLILSELFTPNMPDPPVLPAPAGEDQNQNEARLRTNDWLMLTNYHKPAGDTVAFDDVQIGFYQVIQSDVVGRNRGVLRAGFNARERVLSVTLQGPDFDLFRDWEVREDGTTPVNAGEVSNRGTYAVLIPNVVAVYERTIRSEGDSIWN